MLNNGEYIIFKDGSFREIKSDETHRQVAIKHIMNEYNCSEYMAQFSIEKNNIFEIGKCCFTGNGYVDGYINKNIFKTLSHLVNVGALKL